MRPRCGLKKTPLNRRVPPEVAQRMSREPRVVGAGRAPVARLRLTSGMIE
jgi:hypothetical protein